MNNNTSYETQAIDLNLLSVLDITKEGKVVSAEKWVELWSIVFQHINKIDAFCVDMQSTLDNWYESETALNEIIEDMQMKYASLSTGFTHYGEAPPQNPHIKFWVRRMEDIATHCFLTNEDIDVSFNPDSENAQSGKAVAEAINGIPIAQATPLPSALGSHLKPGLYFATGVLSRQIAAEIDGKPSLLYQHFVKSSKADIVDDSIFYIHVAKAGQLANSAVITIIGRGYYLDCEKLRNIAEYRVTNNSWEDITVDRNYVDTAIGSIVVDQTYNPQSENAQSGKAVAEAVGNKQDKFADVTVDRDGNVFLTPKKDLQIVANNDNGHVALIGKTVTLYGDYTNLHGLVSVLGVLDFGYGNGRISNLAEPTAETDAVNKAYVDGAVENKQDKFATVTHEEQEFVGKITYVTLEGMFYFGNFAYVSETGSLVLTGGCSVADCKICDLKTPTEDTDAANKLYVDTAIGNIETALNSIIALQKQLIGGTE